MKEKLEEILSMLRKEFNQRQELIADNCKDIENTPLSVETIDIKLELDNLNKELRKRNNGNVDLQLAINKYINEQLNSKVKSKTPISYEECFQLTITGDLNYNPLNPFFFDDDFYIELLEYFIEKEDYEKCNLIKRRRSDIIE